MYLSDDLFAIALTQVNYKYQRIVNKSAKINKNMPQDDNYYHHTIINK